MVRQIAADGTLWGMSATERSRLELAVERVATALEAMVAIQRARQVRLEVAPGVSVPASGVPPVAASVAGDRLAPGPVVRARPSGTPWIERTLTPEDEAAAREGIAAMRAHAE